MRELGPKWCVRKVSSVYDRELSFCLDFSPSALPGHSFTKKQNKKRPILLTMFPKKHAKRPKKFRHRGEDRKTFFVSFVLFLFSFFA